MLKISNETKIGLLAVIAIALGIWGFKFLKGLNVLTTSQTFYIRYDNVDQLRPSSPVLINGLQVGMVKDLRVDPQDDKTIIAMINIGGDVQIPKDAVAVIVAASIMGGKAIALEIPHPCSGDDCAQSGDYLQGRTKSFVESIIGNPDQFDAYLQRISLIYDSIANPKDPRGLGRTLLSLQHSLDNIEILTRKLNLLMDASTANITTTLDNAADITASVRKSNATVARLIDNLAAFSQQLKDAELDKTSKKASLAMDSIAQAITALKTTLGSTRHTLAGMDTLLNNVSGGSGTVSSLINDPELYNNLVRTTRHLQLLLQDLRLNPKRYNTVKLKIFGKNKTKGYGNPVDDPAYQLLIDSLENDYRRRSNLIKN